MTSIPQDFLDIDPNPDHWIMTTVAGPNYRETDDLFCVPATESPDGTRLSDMTDAMMSPVAQMDNTVEPRELEDKPWYKFMMAFLMQDGNLGVPGGRYGRDTESCARVAILMSIVMQYHNGDEISYYSLSSDMGQVVNSGDGVASLLSESQYILDDLGVNVRELLGDEYEPQTPLERLAKWAEENGGLLTTEEYEGRLGRITIIVDEDDAEKLVDLVQDKYLSDDN